MNNDKVCGIYKITSPTGCIYIGQSRDCYYRESKYRRAGCKGQHRILNSIKKYGWESHKFEIIHECREEELNHWEKYYVDFFGTFNSEKGLNIRDGGGNKGKPSEETKQLNSVSLKRAYALGIKYRPIGERNGMYGNGHKLEGHKNGRYGKEVTEDTRDKIRNAGLKHWQKTKGSNEDKQSRKEWRKEKLRRLQFKNKKYLGIHERRQRKGLCWYVMICINGKNTYFGTYADERDAVAAYNEAAIKNFGEFAVLNEYKE